MRVAEGVDLDQRGLHVARHERVAHACVGLHDAVTDVRRVEDPGLASGLEDAVRYLLDQGTEVKGPRMAHAVGAFDKDLGLGEVLLGPVHPEAQGISLMVHFP